MKARAAGVTFQSAQRFDAPPAVELREIGGELLWRVAADDLIYDERPLPAPIEPIMIRDRLRCRCARCKRHAERKGGKNINHKFICATCARGSPT